MSQAFELEQGNYSAGFSVPENYAFKSQKGLTKKVVEQISGHGVRRVVATVA